MTPQTACLFNYFTKYDNVLTVANTFTHDSHGHVITDVTVKTVSIQGACLLLKR